MSYARGGLRCYCLGLRDVEGLLSGMRFGLKGISRLGCCCLSEPAEAPAECCQVEMGQRDAEEKLQHGCRRPLCSCVMEIKA